MLTKGQLVELALTKKEIREIDYAVPLNVVKEMRELGVEDPCGSFAVSYNKQIGELMPLAPTYAKAFSNYRRFAQATIAKENIDLALKLDLDSAIKWINAERKWL